MKKYMGAIDQGTTSTRFVIFDAEGRPVAFDQKEHRQIFPREGWVEHDPMEILERTLGVIRGVFDRSQVSPEEVAGLGITNQRETTVIWDRHTGKPIYNALVWQDTRTEEDCGRIAAAHGALIRQKTGLPMATYFSASKIRWILDQVPGARDRAEAGELAFGTIDSWLLWNLSGGTNGGLHVIDPTNASRTLLFNLETLNWDPELLKIFDIPPALLPEIRSSSEVYGEARILPHPLPLAAAIGDQQAALFGQTGFDVGDTKNTYGTGCFLLMNTGSIPVTSAHGLLTTVGCRIPGKPPTYCLEGSVAMAGAVVQWLRDNLGFFASSPEIEALAGSVADNGDVYLVPAFSGLFAPYWRGEARGVITGLTGYSTKAHIARAALEATAYQTRDVLEAMEKDSRLTLKSLKVDGGMTANSLLMQFQADILDAAVVRPVVPETTALGAAYAAGLALGFWPDQESLRDHWAADRTWYPQMPSEDRDRRYRCWKKAVDRSLGWVQGPS